MRGLCYFFLAILTQVRSSTVGVTGLIGQNVTLPCKYSTQTQGVLSFCWGRDAVPMSKCSNTILSSKNGVVQIRQSSRYQLLGETAGDVSLTILNAQWSDAGVYGCRVEVPGWFNDYKINTHLVMEEEISTSAPKGPEVAGLQLITVERTTSEEKLSVFLEVENISRIGAIFFSTIIIILVFIFLRRFKPQSTLRHLKTSPVENIYESVPMPER